MADRPSRRVFLRAVAVASCGFPALLRTSVTAATYFEQGREQFGRDELDPALVNLTKALACDPTDEEALDLRSVVYQSLNDHERAIADRTEIIRLNPSSQNYRVRGVYSLGHDPSLAVADFTEVLQQEPHNADAYFYRAMAYEEAGEYDLALADYAMNARLDPEDAQWVAVDIARVERLQGKG